MVLTKKEWVFCFRSYLHMYIILTQVFYNIRVPRHPLTHLTFSVKIQLVEKTIFLKYSLIWLCPSLSDEPESSGSTGPGPARFDGSTSVLYWADVSSELAIVVPSGPDQQSRPASSLAPGVYTFMKSKGGPPYPLSTRCIDASVILNFARVHQW